MGSLGVKVEQRFKHETTLKSDPREVWMIPSRANFIS
jgi:hypothetical protein